MIRIVIAVIGIFVTTAAGLCNRPDLVVPPAIGCRTPVNIMTDPGEFPYTVSVQLVTVGCTEPSYHICSGAILDYYTIVTSAYCVSQPGYSANLLVKAGKTKLNVEEETEQSINVLKLQVHDYFRGQPGEHDIALLILERPLLYTSYVLPINLPPVEGSYFGTAYFTGWDTTLSDAVELQKFETSIVSSTDCDMMLDGYFDASDLNKANICGRTKCGARSLCTGHYGGALMSYEKRGPVVIGIATATGAACGPPGTVSVYTEVSQYVRWISRVMEK